MPTPSPAPSEIAIEDQLPPAEDEVHFRDPALDQAYHEFNDILQSLAEAGEYPPLDGEGVNGGGEGANNANGHMDVEIDHPQAGPSNANQVESGEEDSEGEDEEGEDAEGEEDDDMHGEEGEGQNNLDDEPKTEQLREVTDDDRGFYDLLVLDLKECIDEPAWNIKLWAGVFLHEYGWDPVTLLGKYFALIAADVPAFAEKLEKEQAAASGDVKLRRSAPKVAMVRAKLPSSATFDSVLQELTAWNWDDPGTTKLDFVAAYVQKHVTNPSTTLHKFSSLFKELVPAFAARMKANLGGYQRVRPPQASAQNPRLEGPEFEAVLRRHSPVQAEDMPFLLKVTRHMRAWDWDDPDKDYKYWRSTFVQRYGQSPNPIMEQYRSLLRELVPLFGKRGSHMGTTVSSSQELDTHDPDTTNGPDDSQSAILAAIKPAQRPLFNLVIQDIRKRDWTLPTASYAVWRDTFKQNYGRSPDTILSQHKNLVNQMCPEFASRQSLKFARGNAKIKMPNTPREAEPSSAAPFSEEEDSGEASSYTVHHGIEVPNSVREYYRSLFALVVRSLRKYDWSTPPATRTAWRAKFEAKYSKNPESLFTQYHDLIKALCPAYAARPPVLRADELDADGIKLAHRELFDIVVEDLRVQDWSDPLVTQKQWIERFSSKHGGHAIKLTTILSQYGPQIKRMVPGYASRMQLNRTGQSGNLTPRTPPQTLAASQSRSHTYAERQAMAKMRANAALQVNPAYRDLFNLVLVDMDAFDWTCEGVAITEFFQHFKRKHRTGMDLTRLLCAHGSLLRRCCPGFASRMDTDRVQGGLERTPRRQRIGNGHLRAQSSDNDSDIQLLSHMPSRRPSPRPAPYPPPRRMGPLSFQSALAHLEVESYRHRSSGTLLPQLPSFAEYLSSEASSAYAQLVERIRGLDPLIEAKLSELRGVAQDVDALQSAVSADWAVLQASSTGASPETAMDVDGGAARTLAWEDRQAAAISRRNVLKGHRVVLEQMCDERAKCLARVKAIDEAVVGARARIEAALMDDD